MSAVDALLQAFGEARRSPPANDARPPLLTRGRRFVRAVRFHIAALLTELAVWIEP